MDNTNNQSNPVSPTLGDTLSDADRQNLRSATNTKPSKLQNNGAYGQSMASKGYGAVNQWQQSALRRHIQEHPVKTAGLVLLTGFLLSSLFSDKN